MISREEFVKEWCQDLHNGGYEQTTSQLADEDGYCCLGVACLTGQRLGIPEAKWGFGQMQADCFPGKWFTDIMGHDDPPLPVLENNEDGTGIMSCSNANDNYGYTFDQIADLLFQRYGK